MKIHVYLYINIDFLYMKSCPFLIQETKDLTGQLSDQLSVRRSMP